MHLLGIKAAISTTFKPITAKQQQSERQSRRDDTSAAAPENGRKRFMYLASAIVVLILHLGFIAWVIFGAAVTRSRPVVTALHVLSFIWGLLVEIFPWSCPLTLAENWLELRAGAAPYQGGFVLHYLDMLVYPNLPSILLTAAAILVVAVNVIIYGRRWREQTMKIHSIIHHEQSDNSFSG
jgi:hypothetical protein